MEEGSILLVVLGVLAILALIGLSFVLFARTESASARNFREMARAELEAEAEVARVKSILLQGLYPLTGTGFRMSTKSHTFPNADDGYLFGYQGDGSGILQVSFGGTTPLTVDNATDNDGDTKLDSIWREFPLSNGLRCRIATLVVDHDGLANINAWGNTQRASDGGHNAHQGLSISELNLQRALGLDTDTPTYRQLFYGDGTYWGRYGLGAYMRPGLTKPRWAINVTYGDDNRDTYHVLKYRDRDADDYVNEPEENVDEPQEYCYSNPYVDDPRTPPYDSDRPFDLVDEWELLHNLPGFLSRFELLMGTHETALSQAFLSGTNLGPLRRNLTTLSADPEWVGVGAVDTADRLSLRVDLNYGTRAELEAAGRQAGLTGSQARQLAVNIVDYRDTGDDVTADGPYSGVTFYGHKRQPYINEFFADVYRSVAGGPIFRAVAIELYNPYDQPLNVYLWELRITYDASTSPPSVAVVPLDNSAVDGPGKTLIPPYGYLTLVSVDVPVGLDRYAWAPPIESDPAKNRTILLEPPIPPDPPANDYALPFPVDQQVYRIGLVRARQIGLPPNPANGELVVDDTLNQIDFRTLTLPRMPPVQGAVGHYPIDVQRPVAVANVFAPNVTPGPDHTLGKWNNPNETTAPSIAAVNALIAAVQALGLAPGLTNSLVSKLQNTIDALSRNQITAAINKIGAFINEVQAQSGTGIPVASANSLIAQANAILNAVPMRPRFTVPIVQGGPWTFGSIGELGEVLNYTQNGNTPYTDDYAPYVAPGAVDKERGIKFDLTGDWYAGGPDNPNRCLLDLVCVNRPDHDRLDNDGNGLTDEPAEASWPVYGKLNINTASIEMMARAFTNGPYAKTRADVLASRIAGRREIGLPAGDPFRHIGDIFRNAAGGPDLAGTMASYGTNGIDDDGDTEPENKAERDARFRYLANLITTRSNVFTVYVTVEVRSPDGTERRAWRQVTAVLDRSRAAMTVKQDPPVSGQLMRYITSPVIQRGFRSN